MIPMSRAKPANDPITIPAIAPLLKPVPSFSSESDEEQYLKGNIVRWEFRPLYNAYIYPMVDEKDWQYLIWHADWHEWELQILVYAVP